MADGDLFYGTADGFTAYLVARGNPLADVYDDPADIIPALIVASEWMDGAYRNQFMGLKIGARNQIREWPRSGVEDMNGYSVDSASIPIEVQNAAYEAALRQLQTPGSFFKDFTPSKYSRVAISGAIDVTFNNGSALDFQLQLPAVGIILAPLLTGYGKGSALAGSVSRA